MRLADWPRMPYLNDELREWIAAHLATLGVEEIAIYAVDPQRGQDEERRVMVATEVGLIDGWYAPRGGSSARYGFTARLWPWQAVRGVDLRGETYRVWALEHRTRWWLRLARPAFESETDAPELGAALCDFAKVCAVMAEPAGWQAAQEEVPQRREGLRVLPAPTEVPPEAGADVETTTPVGRPAVPPPMAGPAVPPAEPQPIRPEMTADVASDEVDETDGSPDRHQDAEDADPPVAEAQAESEERMAMEAVTDAGGATDGDDATAEALHQEPVPVSEAAADDAEAGAGSDAPPGARRPDAEHGDEALTPVEVAEPRNGNGSSPLGDALARRLGPLAARREARLRDREARQAAVADTAAPTAETVAQPVTAIEGDEPAPESARVTADHEPETGRTGTLPEGEEAVDLGAFGPGEEPINLNEYDPDPLGLDGPLHR